MKIPGIITTTLASATTASGAYTYDVHGMNIGSLQLNASLSSADTAAITLKISNDGVNFVGFSTAKTVTFTGGGTVNALFELGVIDYAYLQVNWGAPSAGSLTLVGVLYGTPTVIYNA